MSWLFAVNKAHDGTRRVDSYCHATPLWSISTPEFYLALGGNPDTSFWESNTETSSGWAVVGIGIMSMDSQPFILTRDDWRRLLRQESFDATTVDGHFVVLRWKHDRIECFTDQLGLRTVYFRKHDTGICISTRLDWVAQTTNCAEIDFSSLGSRWLLFNQVSYESCVVGIERLGPGGHATFKNGLLIHSTAFNPWLASFESGTTAKAVGVLTSLVNCALSHKYKPSLGLSGGLDSRLLLALLAKNPKSYFATHTFGNLGDPDVQIAQRITAALGIPHRHFDDPLPNVQTCVSGLRSFVAQTLLIEPSTSYLKLRYYPKLREDGRLMIDGGFGEIARRQYLNRVVRLGRGALRRHDSSRLLQLMRSHRADFFSPDVTTSLRNGAIHSLEKTLSDMPAVERIGVENFADLLAVRTRVPNYGAPEQARLDSEILNFMPLVQPSFLRAVFGIPTKLRSNAGLYYGIIRTLNPALGRFPLAKSGYTYRFGLSSNLSWLITKVKSKFAEGYSDPKPHLLLAHLREYVLDVAHSKDVTTNSMYDSQKVVDAVSKYYRGDLHSRGAVDWWLTFELWKRSLSFEDDQAAKGDLLHNMSAGNCTYH
jgi:hypothetical protein